MKDNLPKVVILNRLQSPYVSEAIIILKDSCTLPQSRAIEEAEKVVRSYLERTAKNGQSQKTVRHCSGKITAVLCICAAVVSFAVSVAFLR